jgi:hypothetical protein
MQETNEELKLTMESIPLELEERLFSKFEPIFTSMISKLDETSKHMLNLVDIQTQLYQLELDTIQREKQNEAIQDVGNTVIDQRNNTPSIVDETRDDAGSRRQESTSGIMSTLLSGLGPGIGTFIGAALGISSWKNLGLRAGSLLIRAIPLAALAPAIGSFIGDFINTSLTSAGMEGELASALTDPLAHSIMWGSLGLIFGKRGALVGFVGSLVSYFSENLLSTLGMTSDGMSETVLSAFGFDFSTLGLTQTVLAALGGTLALLAPKLLTLAGSVLLPILTGPIGLAALTGAALIGTIYMVKNWLEERRTQFIQDLEENVRRGFANLDDVATEGDISGIRRIGLMTGIVSPSNRTEELDALRRTISTSVGGAIVTDGPYDPSQLYRNLPETELETFRSSVNTIVGETPLTSLSDTNLTDLNSIAEMLNMQDLIEEIRQARLEITQTARLDGILHEIAIRNQEIDHILELFGETLGADDLTRLDQDIETLQSLLSQGRADGSLPPERPQNVLRIEATEPRATPGYGEGILFGETRPIVEEDKQLVSNKNSAQIMRNETTKLTDILSTLKTFAETTVNNFVYAPTTVAPVTNITKGGSSVSSVTTNSVTNLGSDGSGLGKFAH